MSERKKSGKKIIGIICICVAVVLVIGGMAYVLSSYSKKIDTLDKQIDELSNEIDDIDTESNSDGDSEDFDFDSEIHDIYDDTAVVDAYKSGDDSALTDEKDKYIYEELKKAVDEIITDDMSDYDKELAVYTYIYKGTYFDQSSLSAIDTSGDYSHTPYGFFHDHNTICVGNATTFKLFMDVLGIESDIIHSTSQGEHAWNIVNIDGDWYHCDITFESGSTTEPLYTRFNVTDSVKIKDGYPWNPEDFHECTATKYNYFVQNAVSCDDIYEIPSLLKTAYDSGDGRAYFKLSVPENVDSTVFASQLQCIFDYISGTNIMVVTSESIAVDEGSSIVEGIMLSPITDVYASGDAGEVSDQRADIDYSKMASAFDEAFGGDVTLSADAETYEWNYIYSAATLVTDSAKTATLADPVVEIDDD